MPANQDQNQSQDHDHDQDPGEDVVSIPEAVMIQDLQTASTQNDSESPQKEH